MLRGSSRHDGIPNNSARERDRQRERQRQERLQMLPTEDKDITPGIQDLFESPPVRVDPGTEDQTTAEIKKQLGNFDSVRHYILDNPYCTRRLIGVDQNTTSTTTSGTNSNNNRPTITSASQPVSLKPSAAGPQHPRLSSNSTANTNNKTSGIPNRNFTNSSASAQASSASAQNSSIVAGFRSTFVPVPLKQSLVVGNSHQSQILPPPPATSQSVGHNKNNSVTLTTPSSSTSASYNFSNSNHNNYGGSGQVTSAPVLHALQPTNRQSASLPSSTIARKPNNSSFNHTSTASTINSNVVISNSNTVVSDTVSSSNTARNTSGCGDVVSPSVNQPLIVPKVEQADTNSIGTSDETSNNYNNSASSTSNDIKPDLSDGFNKKPVSEVSDQTDVKIELASMIKEMMDVKPALTAIQTPGNDTQIKKVTQRRSSKGEDIVQSLRESGMTSIPSPVKKMDSSGDSSSSYESDSESDSEDSSSGSQAGGDKPDGLAAQNTTTTTNSPTRNTWDLSSFIPKGNNISSNIKGAPDSSVSKDLKGRDSLHSTIDSEESPGEIQFKGDSNVSSTSIFGKSMSSSPIEIINTVLIKSPRRVSELRPDSHISVKPPPSSIPTKGSSTTTVKTKGASLSESSSEDESKSKSTTKDIPARAVLPDEKRLPLAKKRRKSLSSSPERNPAPIRSPEPKNKSKKSQDRNKNDSIRNVFRIKNAKLNSPTSIETEKPSKSNVVSTTGKGKLTPTKGKGKSNPKATSPGVNRVSGKDSGKKSVAKATTTSISVSLNGSIDPITGKKVSAASPKKKDVVKKTSTVSSAAALPKKVQKVLAGAPNISITSLGSMLPPPSMVRVKEEAKLSLPLSQSSLICRIPLSKLPKRPRLGTSTTTSVLPSKSETPSVVLGSREDISRVRLHYDSSRVGSSSDQANVKDLMHVNRGHVQAVDPKKQAKRSKKITSSQRKGKVKPSSSSKVDDEDCSMAEVSSNVPGYSTMYDSGLVSTSRPPVDMDLVQAPDSSLNPSHLQSPVVQPQPVYFSYFEKMNHANDDDDLLNSLDQDSYLETAKRLKHKADKEECGGLTQVFTYLESGLYFILTGIAIEKERPLPSKEAFTMYKDTLHLIRYIGNRFRSRPDCLSETKIMVLGLRCQALLALKLYKMKMKESKEIGQLLTDHFQKAPPSHLEIAHSPQLSTPSPHSPTSSPASSFLTGLTPSPHHPYLNHQHPTISRNLYAQMYKHNTNTTNLMQAHEMWESADNLVERIRLEDFFISIDRIYGPLTLHSSLTDLVRYVKHGIKVLKDCADIS